ncbi:MAG: SLBB domain-containing protein, partial [candidate division KSB1 bacterium]|nr:SLBB domain-containing protein [candidate division KSB1 bacterium]
PQAMLNGAYVQRRSMEEVKDREFERLDYLISTDMDPFEKAYYRERARELKGLVSVDFVALFQKGKKEYDIALQDRDLIVVPAVENTVYVVGHVKNPGLLPYEPGKSYEYYIKRAGGYNSGAWSRKVKIKKAGTGELLSPRKTQVEMGDMIFVPQRVEKDFWETFRDVAVVTTQIATMVMVITQINYWTSLRK